MTEPRAVHVQSCDECSGEGWVRVERFETISHEMAIDAGDRSLEGQTVHWGYEAEHCPKCHGSGAIELWRSNTRIVHLADIHLGYKQFHRSERGGLNLRESDIYYTFARVIDKIIEIAPALVVIGGDVFHMVRPGNPAILFAHREFTRLMSALPECEIVMVAGNHDLPRTNDNVCLLKLFEQLGIRVAIDTPQLFSVWGGELSVLAVPQGVWPRPVFEPVAESRFNLLLMHGELAGITKKPRLNGKEIMQDELDRAKSFDYIALGDWHSYQQVAERAYYSGSIDYTSTDIWGESRISIADGNRGKGIIEHDLASGAHRFHQVSGRRMVLDLAVIESKGKTASEINDAIHQTVALSSIRDQIVRLTVANISKVALRDLDHRAIREFKREAMHFLFNVEREDDRERSLGIATLKKKPLREIVAEELASRELPEDVDRSAFIELGLHYLDLAEEKLADKAGIPLLAEQVA